MRRSDVTFDPHLGSGFLRHAAFTPVADASDIEVRQASHDHKCPGGRPGGQTQDQAAGGGSSGRLVEQCADRGEVVGHVSAESASWCRIEVCWGDHDEPDSVSGDEFVAAGIVKGPLDTAVDSAHGQTIGFVE